MNVLVDNPCPSCKENLTGAVCTSDGASTLPRGVARALDVRLKVYTPLSFTCLLPKRA